MRKFLRRFFAELSARVRLAGSQLIKIHTTTDTAKKSVKQGITVSLFQRASYDFFDAVNFRPALFFMDAGFRPALFFMDEDFRRLGRETEYFAAIEEVFFRGVLSNRKELNILHG